MKLDRRTMLGIGGSATLAGLGLANQPFGSSGVMHHQHETIPQVHALVPVVGDGKWISREPPKESGYYEPRRFDLSVEIRMQGTGNAQNISAFTAAPVAFPEQRIEDFKLEHFGCQAKIQPLTPTSARLLMHADAIRPGQVIAATAKYRLNISKSYFGYAPDLFPEVQDKPQLAKAFLGDGPGIKASSQQVRKLAREVQGDLKHPWKIAETFREWVWQNIEGRYQDYTNVQTALRKRVGDCEERAAVFVALCRACEIPARLVWVPNHVWAEFLLFDEGGAEHWIPAHTAAYSWFGWTGAHELILQKGDKIPIPGKPPTRLIYDNIRCMGKQPDVQFTASLTPVAEESDTDPGPGARQKQPNGPWKLVGNHDAQKFMRE